MFCVMSEVEYAVDDPEHTALLIVLMSASYSTLGWDPPEESVPHPVTVAGTLS